MFKQDGVLYRQVNHSYRSDYDLLIGSGLYGRLVDDGWLVPHEEVDLALVDSAVVYKVLRPELIPFISYPYEWSFGQFKAAALLTLAIQKRAIEYGMTLKDCTAYNVQFRNGRVIFIDTLSFEAYREGSPWVAYRQFCQHFLAPLALMSLTDVRLNQLSRTNIDGIPLDLASRLLPKRTKLWPALAIHIHLHAKMQTAYAGTAGLARSAKRQFGRGALLGLIGHLESAIRRFHWEPGKTQWAGYYQENSYTDSALSRKEAIVAEYLDRIRPATAWDLGANTGRFSRVAAARGITTVAFDVDPGCVELNYLEVVKRGDSRILPLMLDLLNPSPGTGWQNRERASLVSRGPVDVILALALVHHLAIANNIPLLSIAEFLQQLGQTLLIEFVPKRDPQVARLLASREDIFPDYHQDEFERCFRQYFDIEASDPIPDSGRVMYLMRGRGSLPESNGCFIPF
ncbi:SAM-dependent methyltransferase (plasmid) [Singulisphaera sp. Ch08]|uniref:SAM-dependent methyltransferase n=1 Tax=Singulisphaera sp. Ch08 TaxID=3120278 RepID=A0AAU7CUX9_9BACT